MKSGDRVWLVEDIEQHNRIVVGTILRVSSTGYVRVMWDHDFPVSHFTPGAVSTSLRVVEGDDALPRHDWDCKKDQVDPPCLKCGVIQTDNNEHEACES